MKKILVDFKAFLLLNYLPVASASSALITPALPQIEKFYQLSHGSLEWVVSIFLIGYMLGQLFYGPLADRIGRLQALRIGLFINLLGIIICYGAYLFPNYSILILGRFITAFGSSSGLVCVYILINESFNKNRAKVVIAYSIIAFSSGIALAIFFGSLITQYIGWQYCFALLFIHGAMLLYFTRSIQETYPPHLRLATSFSNSLKLYVDGFSHPKLIAFSVIVGLFSNFAYSYSVAAPIISVKFLGLSTSAYGIWNCINFFGMIGGGVVAPQLIKALGGMQTKKIGLAFLVVCLLSLTTYQIVVSKSALWFFLTTSAMYFSGGLVYSSAAFYASNALTDKATASSIMNFVNIISAAIAVIIMGYLPFTELVSLIVVVSLFTVIAIALLIYLRGYKEPV